MRTILIFSLLITLITLTVSKRQVFIENNTPFNLNFEAVQSGDPFPPELWGFTKDTIRSGLRRPYFWFPKQNGFQNEKKYRFVVNCVTPVTGISILFFVDGKREKPEIKYQIKLGDSLSPLNDLQDNYFEFKIENFVLLTRKIGDDIETVFHHLSTPSSTGLNVLAYNIFMRAPKLAFPNVFFDFLIVIGSNHPISLVKRCLTWI
jgi:hypothetical protein